MDEEIDVCSLLLKSGRGKKNREWKRSWQWILCYCIYTHNLSLIITNREQDFLRDCISKACVRCVKGASFPEIRNYIPNPSVEYLWWKMWNLPPKYRNENFVFWRMEFRSLFLSKWGCYGNWLGRSENSYDPLSFFIPVFCHFLLAFHHHSKSLKAMHRIMMSLVSYLSWKCYWCLMVTRFSIGTHRKLLLSHSSHRVSDKGNPSLSSGWQVRSY